MTTTWGQLYFEYWSHLPPVNYLPPCPYCESSDIGLAVEFFGRTNVDLHLPLPDTASLKRTAHVRRFLTCGGCLEDLADVDDTVTKVHVKVQTVEREGRRRREHERQQRQG